MSNLVKNMVRTLKILSLQLLLGFLLFLTSCSTTQNVPGKERNLADIYNPSRTALHPDFSAHHVNDSSSVVYIRVFPAELLFNQANERGDFLAFLEIRYYLFEVGKNNQFLDVSDSATIKKTLNRQEVRNSYFSALPVKAYLGKRYMLRIDVEDELRRSISRNYLVLDKQSPFSSQNFRVLSARTGYPVFTNNFAKGEEIFIRFNRMGVDSIYVDYYNMDRTLPRPIFSSSPEIPMQAYPDSSWSLAYNDTARYSLDQTGIFMFKMDKDIQEGISLFNFGPNYPRVKTPDDLLGPLVYLSSSAEFRDLRMEPNRKLAVDNFWLNTTGDMDAARELIRVYYNRVLFSNLYFSSYKEGWKTDRGMIYIVFGPPDILDKMPDKEVWKYLTRRSGAPVEFIFDRKDNPFTYNNYELDRRTGSTSLWAEAVRTWRRGKIYSPEY